MAGVASAEAPGGINLAPPQGLFGFPGGQFDAPLPATWRFGLLTTTASFSMIERSATESLYLDGETVELRAYAERRVGDHWSLAIEIPYRWHESGGLDTLIDTWHKAFGLPDGVRDDRPQDQLRLRYVRDGAVIFSIDGATRGVGDARLTARRALGPNWIASAAIKLPTGDADRLTGSGGADVSAGLWWRSDRPPGTRVRYTAAAGALYLGASDLDLPGPATFGWFAQAGVEIGISDVITLGGRLQATSAVADSALSAFGEPGVMLVVGGEARLPASLALTISVSEDLSVETAPDVTFNVGLRWRIRD